MRLLLESTDSNHLLSVRLLLEQNGIPVFVSSANTHNLLSHYAGVKKGLWVCLDMHYADAVALLTNPEHEVNEPVDIRDFEQVLAAGEAASMSVLLDYMWVAILVGLGVIILLAVIG